MYFADLHIHSRFSRATSPDCNFPELARWAALKGINVLATGDFTHPEWSREIHEMLVEEETGLFRLKKEFCLEDFNLPAGFRSEDVRFILNVEISSIYKRDGAVRKVHNLVVMPDLDSMDRFRARLDRIGNIKSDGRPILGLDCRDLLEIALETSADSFLIPAHVWTPWFSILGSKSGFDAVEECFRDLSSHIFALETGLSSDPEMNFRVSSLDQYTLISNSDTHSPSKLGREANIFEGEPGYDSIREAIRAGGSVLEKEFDENASSESLFPASPRSSNFDRFLGTIEFFPEEGKYHLDGHRKCSLRLEPSETERFGGKCPVCGQAVTVGVMNRVNKLADREPGVVPNRAAPFWRMLPLMEIVAQVLGVGPQSKRVEAAYMELLRRLGPELTILWSHPIEHIACHTPEIFVEAIRRVRNGEVSIKAGFDGEYGIVELFGTGERELLSGQESFLSIDRPRKKRRDNNSVGSVSKKKTKKPSTSPNGLSH
jgi:PHP family Zn ribbon phosphoesterase